MWNNIQNHTQQVLDNETLYVKNQVYANHSFTFPFTPITLKPFVVNDTENVSDYSTAVNGQETEFVHDPVFVVDTIDACWSHAIIDCIIAWYWVYCKYMKTHSVVFFIRKRLFDYFPGNHSNVHESLTRYKDVYELLLNPIPHTRIIFEHTIPLNKKFCFSHCFHYTLDDKHQTSVWNTQITFPTRYNGTPRYSDEMIYNNVQSYVQTIRQQLNVHVTLPLKKNVLIIERKHNRFFDTEKLIALKERLIENRKVLNYNYDFNGIVVLEDMTLQEQLQLFSRTHVYFFRHGSCLTNLLWAPPNSLVFDIDDRTNRKNIVQRVCTVTNSRSVHTCYKTFDLDAMMRTMNNYLSGMRNVI